MHGYNFFGFFVTIHRENSLWIFKKSNKIVFFCAVPFGGIWTPNILIIYCQYYRTLWSNVLQNFAICGQNKLAAVQCWELSACGTRISSKIASSARYNLVPRSVPNSIYTAQFSSNLKWLDFMLTIEKCNKRMKINHFLNCRWCLKFVIVWKWKLRLK